MNDRPPVFQRSPATSAAFRAGVKGMRYSENSDPSFDYTVVSDAPVGPIERHFEPLDRIPGLSEPEAAFETGRAVRAIGHVLDSLSIPLEQGKQFLSLLANAVLAFAVRGERQPWGAEDTIYIFSETFKAEPAVARQIQDFILGYARKWLTANLLAVPPPVDSLPSSRT